MIGVLALQGSFAPHLAALGRLGVKARAIRRLADLDGVERLVLPGGESTTISHLLIATGLHEPIRAGVAAGSLAALGTCAGAILLGREPPSQGAGGAAAQAPAAPPAQPDAPFLPPASARVPRQPMRLGVAATEVARNAYGRQVDSFRASLCLEGALAGGEPFEGVFIRAPRFGHVPAQAEVLARLDGEPVLVREGRILLAAFHPELTADARVHAHFLSL